VTVNEFTRVRRGESHEKIWWPEGGCAREITFQFETTPKGGGTKGKEKGFDLTRSTRGEGGLELNT